MSDEKAADTERIEQLTDRIDRLESVAAAQQETIEQLRDSSVLGTWGRRGLLGSIAAALGLASASGSAAAGVGQIGTSSARVDAFLDTFDASSGAIGGQNAINYWPPVRKVSIGELWTTNPATSYTTVSLSALPSDASAALTRLAIKGDGSSQGMNMEIREAGSGRARDGQISGWAGHGVFSGQDGPKTVPVNSANEIEYQTAAVGEAVIDVLGYY